MRKFAIVFWLNLGVLSCFANATRAESAATAPSEITEAIAGIEAAANKQDVDAVMEYYSEDFENSDGLTTETLAEALTQMWQDYPRLKYNTELQSWTRSGDELIAETVTTVRGIQNTAGRQARLKSTIKSRQYFQSQKLVRQEILTEQSRLTSGENPPQVEVVAPHTVTVGQKYNFDLIVDEPLGEQVLLGAVQSEKTAGNLYFNSTSLELEPLPAGGIYKVATASSVPESNWLSAILVRGDGITMITHRVQIESNQVEQQD
ncbi:MAG: nuclear transport factor 2 family protein [Cyanobacteria bacterium J06607_15]